MSDAPSELSEVVDRLMEAISFSNTLTSPSIASSHVALGSMDDEVPITEKKIYMVDEHNTTPYLHEDEEVGHMEPTTTTTPTSYEKDYKVTKKRMSTSIEHKLTKQALESTPASC
jgi:hypothetical protein